MSAVTAVDLRNRIRSVQTVSQVYFHGVGWRQLSGQENPRNRASFGPRSLIGLGIAFATVLAITQNFGGAGRAPQLIDKRVSSIDVTNSPSTPVVSSCLNLEEYKVALASIREVADPSLLTKAIAELFEPQGVSIVVDRLVQLGGYAQLNFSLRCEADPQIKDVKMLSIMQKLDNAWSVSSIQRE